jgi:uncharacterized protein (DUF58 family)
MSVTETKSEPREVAVPCSFDVLFAVDASGSMAGSPLRAVLAAVGDIYSSVLADNDGLGLLTFSGAGVRSAFGLTKKRELADLQAKLGTVAASGCTPLWDGIFAGVAALHGRSRVRPPRPSHPYLVVLTDGEDTSSTRTADEVAALLAKPSDHGFGGLPMANFHATFVTVGAAASSAISAVCGRKPHLVHVPVSDASKLADAFRRVQTQMTKHFTVTRRSVVVQDSVTLHARHAAAGPTSAHAVRGALAAAGGSRRLRLLCDATK